MLFPPRPAFVLIWLEIERSTADEARRLSVATAKRRITLTETRDAFEAEIASFCALHTTLSGVRPAGRQKLL
ncbi:hypothetical protein PSAC2689_20049 [Paraburkholderia sacchari]